jgi:hypothetical protein
MRDGSIAFERQWAAHAKATFTALDHRINAAQSSCG